MTDKERGRTMLARPKEGDSGDVIYVLLSYSNVTTVYDVNVYLFI